MKLIFRRTTFIPGFCVFLLHHNGSGVSPDRPRLTTSVTHRYAEWLSGELASENGLSFDTRGARVAAGHAQIQ